MLIGPTLICLTRRQLALLMSQAQSTEGLPAQHLKPIANNWGYLSVYYESFNNNKLCRNKDEMSD